MSNGCVGSNSNVETGVVGNDRWRELFPIPLCSNSVRGDTGSSSSRRRRVKVQRLQEESMQVIECLNEMYSSSTNFPDAGGSTTAQRMSQHAIFSQLARQKQPVKPCKEREAVEELLRTSLSYSGDEAQTSVVSYERDLVSLPQCAAEPVALDQVLDNHGRELIKDTSRCMLLSMEEWGQVCEQNQPIKTYMDVKLQSDLGAYAMFVHDLFLKGMIEFTNNPKDVVAPFFVKKKDGRQRMVLDCRAVNRRFRQPPPVALAAGYSWTRLELPEHSKLYVAQSDIKDYFYSLSLPEDLRSMFCLPPVPIGHLKRWQVSSSMGGELPGQEGWIWPSLRVVPMGWNWAMYLAQRVHQEQILVATGISSSRILVDSAPAPSLENGEPVIIPYADNLNVCGTDEASVQQTKETIVKHLRGVGFRVHEELDSSCRAQSLGFLIDGSAGVVTPIPDKLQKVRGAFSWLSRRPRVNGKAIEKLVGHATHFMLLRRELLCIFHATYRFIQECYSKRARLWPSVAREAKWACRLLGLCSADLRKPWHDRLTASDASLSGIAVCSRDLPIHEIKDIARYKEAWRFKVNDRVVNPRKSALPPTDIHRDPFSDPNTVKPLLVESEDPFVLNYDFPEISSKVMDKDNWQLRFNVQMTIPEHITLLEGRGMLASVRHKLRSVESFGKRHLHLNDNLGMVLAAEKGRSSTFGMLRICRRLCALYLASDTSFSHRWIPSELNVADAGSRVWEPLRKSQDVAGHSQKIAKEVQIDRIAYPGRSQPSKHGMSHFTSGVGYASVGQLKSNSSQNARWQVEGGEIKEEKDFSRISNSEKEVHESNVAGTGSYFKRGGQRLHDSNASISSLCPTGTPECQRREQLRQCLDILSKLSIRRGPRSRRWHQNTGSSFRQQPRMWPTDPAPRSRRALQGWNRLDPQKTRPPLPWGLVALIALELAKEGHIIECLTVLLSFVAYLRPGEALSIRKQDLILPNRSSNHYAINLHPSNREEESKMGLSDECILLGSRVIPWLGPALHSLRERKGFALLHSNSSKALAKHTAEDRSFNPVCSTLPAASCRSQPRQVDKSKKQSGSQASRTLDIRCVSSTVRETRLGGSSVPIPAQEDSTSCTSSPGGSLPNGPKVFRPKSHLEETWVIEIFSGCARFSRACSSHGFHSIAYDIDYGTACDVTNKKVLSSIFRFIRSHRVALVWLGTPCQSWSMARRDDGGPPPLRSDAFLMEKPGLSSRDKSKVEQGNLFLEISFEICMLCISLNIAWVMENPFTSRIWATKRVQQLIQEGASLDRIDFCAYGLNWRKATGLLHWNFHNIVSACQTCVSHCGRCGFSGRKHIILSGTDASGQWLTRVAQPYPHKMCQKIAGLLAQMHRMEMGGHFNFWVNHTIADSFRLPIRFPKNLAQLAHLACKRRQHALQWIWTEVI